LNTPNKLTILRVALTPVFLALLLWDFPYHYLLALAVFIAASLTDYFDGSLARKRNLVTDFGKFMDPLADKMLTTAAFLGFIELRLGYGVVWVAFIVLMREFSITSLRLVAGSGGRVIAANVWGKTKTVCQIVAIVSVLVGEAMLNQSLVAIPVTLFDPVRACYSTLLWFAALLTVVSGVTYFWENKGFVSHKK